MRKLQTNPNQSTMAEFQQNRNQIKAIKLLKQILQGKYKANTKILIDVKKHFLN